MKKRIIDLSYKDEKIYTYTPKPGTIGNYAIKTILENPNDNEYNLSNKILKKFPNNKINTSHIKWYKNQMKKGGYDV